MGQLIDKLLPPHHTVTHRINSLEELKSARFDGSEVAIEFTNAESCLQNLPILAEKKINTIIGSTGWYDRMEEIKNVVQKSGIGCLWSANFSMGVQIFWYLARHAGKAVNLIPEYDVAIHELHHKMKKDAPSGTAVRTAQILLEEIDRKKEMSSKSEVLPHELQVSATRVGSIPGTHTVYLDSAYDTIELTHTARNREGFATGAIKTAEWITGKKGFFTMDDYLSSLFPFLNPSQK